MRRLLYSKAASRDFVAIASYIRRGSGSPQTAVNFVDGLRLQCRRLAQLPGTLGRSRTDIRPDARSFPVKSYVIVFRYEGEAVEILRVIERHRDLSAQFTKPPD
jgi:toxin ParE1/3/4